jgi:hypothetical protein
VITDEGDEALGVRIEPVVAQNVFERGNVVVANRAAGDGIVMRERRADGEVGGEVEGRAEAGVDAVVHDASSEVRGDDGVGIEDFPDGGEVRIKHL